MGALPWLLLLLLVQTGERGRLQSWDGSLSLPLLSCPAGVWAGQAPGWMLQLSGSKEEEGVAAV